MGTKYISRKKNRRGNWVKYRDDRLVTAQQSTGAAQIANLKYILKNGSTGEFVEALDSIINERVRVALGQLVNNLDKGTGLAKVLGIDASNDLGASSIANLASVLSDVIGFKHINIELSGGVICTGFRVYFPDLPSYCIDIVANCYSGTDASNAKLYIRGTTTGNIGNKSWRTI